MRVKFVAVSVFAVGSLLAVGGCSHHHEDEEVVALDSVPAAAREGINKQLAGATATKVERETEHGRTVYEVQTMRDGKKVEFKVDENGNAVGKEKVKGGGKEEEEDDEKDEHHRE